MIWVFLLVVAVALVAVFAALITGRLRYDPMSEPVTSAHDPGLPEAPHARDIDGVRFDRSLRGYRMDQVDGVLDALRDTLARQETTISALRRGSEVLGPVDAPTAPTAEAARHGSTADPDVPATANRDDSE